MLLKERARVFFDDYPRFLETSTTASEAKRLGIRHEVMIERYQHLLHDRRVLDIASHDGRWTFAALRTGQARHVTGVEARGELVRGAHENLAHYGADPTSYRFVEGDVFDALADPAARGIEVDVVMCLGFLYHTRRYSELLAGIRALEPEHVLLDTAVFPSPKPVVKIFGEDTSMEFNSADNPLAHRGHMLTGRPSVSALELMLGVHGFEVVERVDWPDYLARVHPDVTTVESYRTGRRVTWVCRPV